MKIIISYYKYIYFQPLFFLFCSLILFLSEHQNKNMTQTETYLNELSLPILDAFKPIFDSIEKFYAVNYLIIKNERILSQEKPELWEEKIKTVQWFKDKIEHHLNAHNLNGKDIIADIASDYFEDYVHYKDQDFGMTNEEFISYIKQIQGLS